MRISSGDSTIYGSFGFSALNFWAYFKDITGGIGMEVLQDATVYLGIASSFVGVIALLIKTYFNIIARRQEMAHADEKLRFESEKHRIELAIKKRQLEKLE